MINPIQSKLLNPSWTSFNNILKWYILHIIWNLVYLIFSTFTYLEKLMTLISNQRVGSSHKFCFSNVTIKTAPIADEVRFPSKHWIGESEQVKSPNQIHLSKQVVSIWQWQWGTGWVEIWDQNFKLTTFDIKIRMNSKMTTIDIEIRMSFRMTTFDIEGLVWRLFSEILN